jgi:hypothetical protein
VALDDRRAVYLTYNVINLLVTTDPRFCAQIERSIRVLMQKSTLISGTSAKERNRFFNHLEEKVRAARERILRES